MGVKLIKWDGKRLYKFPKEHYSINVCKKLSFIYMELIQDN
ncbi:hypothetical protein ES702_00686 [subsurface metagenome]